MFAARKHSVIMSVNFMFMSDERGVIADRLATRPQRHQFNKIRCLRDNRPYGIFKSKLIRKGNVC